MLGAHDVNQGTRLGIEDLQISRIEIRYGELFSYLCTVGLPGKERVAVGSQTVQQTRSILRRAR